MSDPAKFWTFSKEFCNDPVKFFARLALITTPEISVYEEHLRNTRIDVVKYTEEHDVRWEAACAHIQKLHDAGKELSKQFGLEKHDIVGDTLWLYGNDTGRVVPNMKGKMLLFPPLHEIEPILGDPSKCEYTMRVFENQILMIHFNTSETLKISFAGNPVGNHQSAKWVLEAADGEYGKYNGDQPGPQGKLMYTGVYVMRFTRFDVCRH
jgi:hypothetical protein